MAGIFFCKKNDDYRERISEELFGSKKAIEKQLAKQVAFICWPGGAYNHTVLTIAKQIAYKAWTLSSRDQSDFRNRPGSDPNQIKRIGSFPKYRMPDGKEYGDASAYSFLCAVERHKGSLFNKYLGRILKLGAVFKSSYLKGLPI